MAPALLSFSFLTFHPPRSSPTLSFSTRTCAISRSSSGEKIPTPPLSEKPPWVSTDKMPNPPWITGPHLRPAEQPRDLFQSKNNDDGEDTSHGYLTDKVRGGRGWRAMRSIVASITRLRDIRPLDVAADVGEAAPDFSIHLEHASGSMRAPWTKAEEKIVFRREKKGKLVTAAELTLPEPLLLRLRGEAREMTKWVKAKKAGITQDVVNGIKTAWRRSELAMVKIVDPLCRNLDRAREIVESLIEDEGSR